MHIVSIGIDSTPEKWKAMIEKHQLKTLNLIASDQWNDVVSEKFDIQSLPHSILIDWEGKVVQNKCPRASENVDKQIDELLQKMKLKANSEQEK